MRRLERRLSAARHPTEAALVLERSPMLIGNLCALNALVKTSGWPPGSETPARAKRLPSSRKWNGSSGTRAGRSPRTPCGPWPTAGRRLRGPGRSMTPNQPYLLVKDLEASAKGCQALLDEWTILRSRVEDNVPWQPPDRLKAIRMLEETTYRRGHRSATRSDLPHHLRDAPAWPEECVR